MSALDYEPFVVAGKPSAWFIERVPADKGTGNRIQAWKLLVSEGWDVTVLLSNDDSHIVAFGCRYGWLPECPTPGQLSLLEGDA